MYCPKCGNEIPDAATFCSNCGFSLEKSSSSLTSPYDHTADFDAADIKENKLYAMVPYLLGILGVALCYLIKKDSPYLTFHCRENIRLFVIESILSICAAVLCITIIVPVAAVICVLIVEVIRIIGFFRVCSGKAIDLPIIRSFGFLA